MSPDTITKQNIISFAERFLELERQKEILKQDVKALREEYNQEGVPTQVVTRCINSIKRMKKKTSAELYEEEAIEEWLLSNTGISDSISELIAK